MNRDELEAGVALAVQGILRDAEQKALKNPRAVSWPQFQSGLQAALAAKMQEVFAASGQHEAEARGDDLQHTDYIARHWAQQQAYDLSMEITRNTQQIVSAAIKQQNEQDLALALGVAFSSARASNIGVTETTRAITAGQRFAVVSYDLKHGTTSVPFWVCEDGACKVCRPLDDKRREYWPDAFRFGPPAHPNCRCGVRYETRRSFSRKSLALNAEDLLSRLPSYRISLAAYFTRHG